MESSTHNTLNTLPSERGFTLVELLVVLAIITIITLVTLLSQQSFNRSMLLTSTAYTVALSVREAQSLGLSSRAFNGTRNAGHGVTFASGMPSTYRIFSDTLRTAGVPGWCPTGTAGTPEAKPGNCLFDSANLTEVVSTFNLNKGFTISDFCGITPSGSQKYCSSHSGTTALSGMDVVFLRPNTESVISGLRTNGSRIELACAVIWIKPPGTDTNRKCVVVSQVGQVSVPQACPAASFTSCP